MSNTFREMFPNEVIRASAGTGKTFALSNRYLRLLAYGVDCSTILATTFTRTGAGEILDRIVQRLAEATTDERAALKLATELDWQLDQQRVRGLLRGLIGNLHRLQIGTLDAFFFRIAQSFRLEMGLPTQWQIVSEQQIAALQQQIIQQILRDESVVQLLHLMTHGEAQRKIADLICETVRDLYDIKLQSTETAWTRIPKPHNYNPNRQFNVRKDLTKLVAGLHKSLVSQTEEELRLIEACNWKKLATESIVNAIAIGKNKFHTMLPQEMIDCYGPIIEQCRDYLLDMLSRRNESSYRLLAAFEREMEREKTERGALRFDDITMRLEQFAAVGTTDAYAYRLDNQIDHLLLDEFQDTSIAQWNVLLPFSRRVTGNGERSLFCVGDLKQAIFGWRGGVSEIFDSVQASLSNVQAAPSLLVSFRSSQPVIDSVNQVFSNLNLYLPKDDANVQQAVREWASLYEEHRTEKVELPGYFELEIAGADLKNAAYDSGQNDERQAAVLKATVARIQALRSQAPDCNIGVLVRKNETVGELIFLLQEAGIPASEEGGNPLTDSAAVETMLALATLSDHPGDSVARFTLSHSLLGSRLGLLPETVESQPANRSGASEIARGLRQEIAANGFGPWLECYARELAPQCTRRELFRLQQLIQEAYSFDRSADSPTQRLRASQFVGHIREEFKCSDESAARVRVMTIHKSKGLEFDVVVLPMLHDSWFVGGAGVIVGRPHPTKPIDLVCHHVGLRQRDLLPKEIQQAVDTNRRRIVHDNLCVLYVALTRGIHAVHVVMSGGCRKDHLSNAGVLISSLLPKVDKLQNGVAFVHGDGEWFRRFVHRERTHATEAKNQYYLKASETCRRIELAAGAASGRGTPQISPSGLEGGASLALKTLFSSWANNEQMDRGTALHACFELVNWSDEALPTKQQVIDHLSAKGLWREAGESWLGDFFGMLQTPGTRTLLSRQSMLSSIYLSRLVSKFTIFDAIRLESSNEYRFAVILDGQLVQGSIDRLTLIFDGDKLLAADIVDFKTDQVPLEGIAARCEYYRPQLVAYRRAISQSRQLDVDRVGIRLAFVEAGQVIDLDRPFGEQLAVNAQPLPVTNKPNFKTKRQLTLWSDE